MRLGGAANGRRRSLDDGAMDLESRPSIGSRPSEEAKGDREGNEAPDHEEQELRGDGVDTLVGALRRQHRGDQELPRCLEVELALGVRIGLGQQLGDPSGATPAIVSS